MSYFIGNKVSKVSQFLSSLVLIAVVAGVCFIFSDFIGYRVAAFALLLSVSIIAMVFDIWPVLTSALLSSLVWDFFFIPPRYTFHISNTEDLIMLLMYFVIASVSAVLTYKIRQISKVAREEEEKANAVKLYNTLLNSLSHELRTPISTIIGATDNLLNEEGRITEQNKKALLTEISRASMRLNTQVENLLNMSRLESGSIRAKYDWSDVQELIYSVIHQLEDNLAGHKVSVNIAQNMPLVMLDFGLMQEILNNLLNNFALYSAPGSAVTISTEVHHKNNGTVLVLSVADNGPGFPEDEISKVFEKFYRLNKSQTGGTGLGLSIVKGLVEAQKGRITLQNQSSGGALFRIELPTSTTYINNQSNEER